MEAVNAAGVPCFTGICSEIYRERAFVDAGLYRIFVPKHWGGYEMDYTTSIDIAAELGRGCGSSASASGGASISRA